MPNYTRNVTAITNLDELFKSSIFTTAVLNIELDELDLESWSWIEAGTATVDDTTYTLIVRDNAIVAVESNGIWQDHQHAEYSDACASVGTEPMSDATWEELFNVDPGDIVDGPNSVLYPLEGLGDDADERTALAVADLNLCVVVIDGDAYLATTGGQFEPTWGIAEGYMRCGYLPPYTVARQLPSVGSRGDSERDRAVIAGCLFTFETGSQMMLNQHASLIERAAMWADHSG